MHILKYILVTIICALGPASLWAAGIRAQITEQADSVHIEFFDVNQWDYKLDKKTEGKQAVIEIQVPGLAATYAEEFKKFKGDNVSAIELDPAGPDGKTILRLKLKRSEDEIFDYLTDQPSRLIVDIFRKSPEQSTKKVVSKPAKKTPAKATKNSANKAEKSEDGAQRAPAADTLIINPDGQFQLSMDKTKTGIFDGADPNFSRFSVKDYEIKEEALIRSTENVYIDFPILQVETQELDRMQARAAIYDIVPKETDENKQARLLQTLFEKKRHHVFLKTVEWFFNKYPNSEYDEIVRFMLADTLFAIWLETREANYFDLAMLRYRQALEKYPNTQLAERTQLLMGFATLDRGDYLGTLRQFQLHMKNRPSSPNRDLSRMAIAESFLRIGRFEDAIQSYSQIEADADNEKAKVKASFSKPDVYFKMKDYDKAIQGYKDALTKYPNHVKEYPNAYYNQAAAFFWKKNYREGLNTYIEFLKRFPSHNYGGFAMTRIGEVLDILGADQTKSMGAYLETYFRYGDAPSAIVARLRLLSSRMPGMKTKEIDHTISEILSLAKKSDLPKIDQFATLLISDGYVARHEYDKAIKTLVDFYQKNAVADTELLKGRIVRNINDKIREQVESNKYIDAMKTHSQYSASWLKGSQRTDTKYFLAKAFEQAGVQNQADLLYRDALNNLLAVQGTPSEKEIRVFEHLPSKDEIYLRLATVNAQLGKFSSSYDYLREIKSPEALNDKSQIERVQLAAQLLENKGDLAPAIRYLSELIVTWKGLPSLVAEPYYQLGQLELKMGKAADALKSFEKVDSLMVDSEKVNAVTHSKALENIGNIYFDQGQKMKALDAYTKLLAQYENTRPLASIRYRMGQIHFDRGEIQKASDTWKDLKSNKSEFWYQMAQEQLKNSEWRNDYKKYIQRIPAMVKKE